MNARGELDQLSEILESDQGIDLTGLPLDVEDPLVPVLLSHAGQRRGVWAISLGLTDRNGELDLDGKETKPFRALLETNGIRDGGKYSRLVSQMWGRRTSIARKDGNFGLLFEVALTANLTEVQSASQVMEVLLSGLPSLRASFPEVDFAVPSPERGQTPFATVWAFVRDGALPANVRETLGFALENLYEDNTAQWVELWSDTEVSGDFAKLDMVIEDAGVRLRLTLRADWGYTSRSFGRVEVFSKATLQWNEIAFMSASSMKTKMTSHDARRPETLKYFFAHDRNELIRRARNLLN